MIFEPISAKMLCNAPLGHDIIQRELSFEVVVRHSRFQMLRSELPAVVMLRYFLRRDSVLFGIEACCFRGVHLR
jgi:hypothetical protein